MCFSATASFLTTAVTGAIGIVTLSRAKSRRELPLAATPVIFAAQQAVEGLLWLTLPVAPESSIATTLTYLFLVVAQVLWPLFVPIAILLVEPSEGRRRAISFCLAIGIGVAAYFLWAILSRPHGALLQDGHVIYVTGSGDRIGIGVAYVAATVLPLLLSTQRSVIALGLIVAVGFAVTYFFYWDAFVSVWCFFAAAASIVIVWHFERVHRRQLRPSGA